MPTSRRFAALTTLLLFFVSFQPSLGPSLGPPLGSSLGPSLGAAEVMLPDLPLLGETSALRGQRDWLIHEIKQKAGIYRSGNPTELILDNGLVRRVFRIAPNGCTIALDNLMTGASLLRGVKPEALLTIDGAEYSVGGLRGQPDYAYLLPEWIDNLKNDPAAFQLQNIETGVPRAFLPWKKKRHSADIAWPPPGISLTFRYTSPEGKLEGLAVSIHYEIYDGIPLLCKWMVVENGGNQSVRIDKFTAEILAVVEEGSAVEELASGNWRLPPIHVQSDYSFKGMDHATANRTTHWVPDPQYRTQVNYKLRTPAMLVSRPPIGPSATLEAGKTFETFRTFLLVHDSDSRERRGLAVRQMHRRMAPWVTENPLMMHVRSAKSVPFRKAVDQCVEVGFEMIIYTFGSGIRMEKESASYIAGVKSDVEYAHSKGLEVGAYSLLASRRISPEHDAINPKTGKPGGAIFGNSPCLESIWGQDYFRKIKSFMKKTGLDLLEHDGNYPGDVCASTKHPGHRGLEDSQWNQWRRITDLYRWCRERGVYLNVPDYYFLRGSNKVGMGYRETNWSLPRDRQIIHARQNIYDGTWDKTPSMGWMFVPLVQYHGGGAAATLEPLREHLRAYEGHLVANLGAGVQACYRGPRLFDAPETKELLVRWVGWYKKYRAILESDVIHLRRPDGRHVDGLLHVNPRLAIRGLAVLHNPTAQTINESIDLPLYYTGLERTARVRIGDGPATVYTLNREYGIRVPLQIAPRSFAWLMIE